MSENTEAKTTNINAMIRAELESIRQANPDQMLREEEVVEFASDPSTALHDRFVWDDGAAAHQYRLEQARKVIRVTVEVMKDDKPPVRLYVSLESDRQKGGGYRHITEVCSDEEMYAELVDQSRREMQAFQRRYREIEELQPVIAAMQSVLSG